MWTVFQSLGTYYDTSKLICTPNMIEPPENQETESRTPVLFSKVLIKSPFINGA